MHVAKCSALMRSLGHARDSTAVLVVAFALSSATYAQAAVTISSQPTQNMTCTNGLCSPTAKSAALNVGDLETLLASGGVTVTTTGASVEADNIDVKSPLSWATASSLSLEAHRSIAIDAAVSVVGQSGLSLQTGGKNGTFSFGSKGSVGFSNLSSLLTINGVAYTLVGNVKTLAADISANPGGAYALAGTYDASADGTYNASPIGTIFAGTFDGLGNTVMNLSVDGGSEINESQIEGFVAELGTNGTLRDFGLVNANISVPAVHGKSAEGSGALVGWNMGTILRCYATGTVTVEFGGILTYPIVGGLVGTNTGLIANSYTTANVPGSKSTIGGLVGLNEGTVSQSYATGAVSGSVVGGLVGEDLYNGTITGSFATGDVDVTKVRVGETVGGGLVGSNSIQGGTITDSYARGAVNGRNSFTVGGLAGTNGEPISSSYSTGAVTGGTGSLVGGLIGEDGGTDNDNDWDTDTSGVTNLSQGAGTPANDPGITGLSTAQFQSGLPTGFDAKIWAEKPNINGGLPYLLANPPPKN